MPKQRWLTWEGRAWRLSELAVAYRLRPQTLAARIDRGFPLERALATGLCTCSGAGRRSLAQWKLRSAVRSQ